MGGYSGGGLCTQELWQTVFLPGSAAGEPSGLREQLLAHRCFAQGPGWAPAQGTQVARGHQPVGGSRAGLQHPEAMPQEPEGEQSPCRECCSQGWAEGQLSLQGAHLQGSGSHISLTSSKRGRSSSASCRAMALASVLFR